MNSRFRLGLVVALLFIATASVSHAQKADSVATKGALPGRGAIGAQIGGSYIVSGGEYADGSQPRLSFIGHYRYVINKHWGWQISPTFTWNGYVSHAVAPFVDPNFLTEGTSKQFYITQLIGAGSQIQYYGGGGRSRWHLGAGPAIYRVVVQNHRKVVEDPVSRELHSGTHLGATAEFGYEQFSKRLPNTSLEGTVALHTAFSKSDDKWVSGWNDAPVFAEVRFGANYYYDFRRPKTAKGAKK
ncbi:MAG: hypothetical protein K8R56_07050 [Candidatus Eisenbacteria bacterium]|nr:hypothetical protein [Candidatus Eisenbacteria bacterium]